MYKIIASSSKGNSVIYHDCIMIDCGCLIQNKDKDQLLLTSHSDHFKNLLLKK